MSVSVKCSGCGKRMDVPENVRGKTIRCTACGETFKVPVVAEIVDDEDDRPIPKKKKSGDVRTALDTMGNNRKRSRNDDDDDDRDDEPASTTNKPILVAVGVVALIASAVIAFFAFSGKPKLDPVALNNNNNVNNQFPQPNFNPPNQNIPGIPNPMDDPFRPVNNNPMVDDPFRPVQPKGNPVRPNPVRPNPMDDPFRPVAQPFRPENEPEEVAKFGETPWKATVDAPAEKFTLPDDMVVSVPMPVGANDEILYPSTPSPFFVLGNNRSDRTGRALYNLNTMPKKRNVPVKLVGMVKGKVDGIREETVSLSPDGKHMVARSGNNGFEVVSFDDGQTVRKVELQEQGTVEWVDFGENSNQVVLHHHVFGNKKNTIQVWDVAKGEEIRSIEVPQYRIEQKMYALSPNRKYVAFGTNELLYVHELKSGELVGAVKLPKAEAQQGFGNRPKSIIEGMAFSWDGKEVAALIKSDFDKNFWIASWNMANGKSTAEIDVTDMLTGQGAPRNYTGPAIEYMPDGRAWFVRGSLGIDHETGITLFKRDFGNDVFPKQRRILPNGMILEVAKGSGTNGIVANKLDMKAYDLAIAAARGESGPKLETKKADISAAKTITVNANVPFAVQPDVSQPKGQLGPVAVLPKANSELNSIYFARPETAQALVISVTEITTPFVRKVARAERYDLTSKKSLGGFDLPGMVKKAKNANGAAKIIADISPDGTRIAIRSLTDPNRVDVFDGVGKHVVGFLPYEADGDPIAWLGFTAEDRLVTFSSAGKIVQWDVVAAKAVYRVDGSYAGPIVLSPGRKSMAVFAGTSVEVFNTATGEMTGSLVTDVPAPNLLKASLAFRTETSMLVAAIPVENRMQVMAWNLKDGKKTGDCNVSVNMLDGVQFCSDTHVLVGGQELIDLELKSVVWQYVAGNRPVSGGPLPDSRAWVVGAQGTRAVGMLLGVRLPDTQLMKSLSMAKGQGVQTLLKPGMKISIRVDGGKSPEMTQQIVQQLGTRFQQDGFEVVQGAPITYVVNASESPSSDVMELTSFGGVGGGKRTLQVPQVVGTASLVDGGGQSLWSEKNTSKPSSFFRIFRGEEDPAQVLSRDAWNMFSGWATSVRKPTTIYRLSGQTLMLPGSSALPME